MFSLLGLDLTILPLPILLLLIFLIFFIGWYIYIFNPISEELEELKKEIPNIMLMSQKIEEMLIITKKLDSFYEKESYANHMIFENIDIKLLEILEKVIVLNTITNTMINKHNND